MHLSDSVVQLHNFRTDSSATSYTFFRFCVAFGYGNKWLVHLSVHNGNDFPGQSRLPGPPGQEMLLSNSPANLLPKEAHTRTKARDRIHGMRSTSTRPAEGNGSVISGLTVAPTRSAPL